MPKSQKTAVAKWVAGLQFQGAGGSGNTLTMGSTDTSSGFSPMELVLVGLAGCTGMDVIDILRKMKQDVAGLEVRVSGERAEEHPKVYDAIDVEYVVRGRNINAEGVAHAIELSEGRYCSVSAMLAKTARIKTAFRIEEVEVNHAAPANGPVELST